MAEAQSSAASAAKFDALLAGMYDENYFDAGSERVDASLAQLRATLPPGDERRRLQYAGIDCYRSDWTKTPNLEAKLEADLRQAAEYSNPAMSARLILCKSVLADYYGRSAQVKPLVERGLALARQSGDPHLLTDALMWHAEIQSQRGDQAGSLKDLNEAYALLTSRLAGKRVSGNFMLQRSSAYRRMGDYQTALQLLEDPSVQRVEHEDDEWAATVEQQRTYLLVDMDRPADALQSADRAISHARKIGSPYTIAMMEMYKSKALVKLGRSEEALRAAERGLAVDARRDTIGTGLLQVQHGEALQAVGRPVEALQAFQAGASKLEPDGNPRYLAQLYASRSMSLEALGRDAEALHDLRRADALQNAMRMNQNIQQSALREMERVAASQAQDAAALRRARSWQVGALTLGALLVATLSILFIRQRRRVRRYQRMAETDELTGAVSRSAIMERLEVQLKVAEHTQQPVTVLAVDADHFKQVNDAHGHPYGDRVLVELCEAFDGVLRQEDRIGRIGGEEFLVVAPSTTADQAAVIAERLRAAVERRFSATTGTTVSIGVAQSRAGERAIKDIIARADGALYAAKRAGRNRVVVADLESVPGTNEPVGTGSTSPMES